MMRCHAKLHKPHASENGSPTKKRRFSKLHVIAASAPFQIFYAPFQFAHAATDNWLALLFPAVAPTFTSTIDSVLAVATGLTSGAVARRGRVRCNRLFARFTKISQSAALATITASFHERVG
jgi:hypothetical protein